MSKRPANFERTRRFTHKPKRRRASHVLQIQELERRRIARELHDTTLQTLSALNIRLDYLITSAAARTDDDCLGVASECRELTQQCMAELRTLSYLLHPPLLEELGLMEALRSFIDGFHRRSGIAVETDFASDAVDLPRDAETAIYRVIQESLINVQRHSGSSHALVRIVNTLSEVIVEVIDGGHGLNSPATQTGKFGVGIPGMRERIRQLGGRFQIATSKRGTVVRAMVPH